jgi:hypothetical protein
MKNEGRQGQKEISRGRGGWKRDRPFPDDPGFAGGGRGPLKKKWISEILFHEA